MSLNSSELECLRQRIVSIIAFASRRAGAPIDLLFQDRGNGLAGRAPVGVGVDNDDLVVGNSLTEFVGAEGGLAISSRDTRERAAESEGHGRHIRVDDVNSHGGTACVKESGLGWSKCSWSGDGSDARGGVGADDACREHCERIDRKRTERVRVCFYRRSGDQTAKADWKGGGLCRSFAQRLDDAMRCGITFGDAICGRSFVIVSGRRSLSAPRLFRASSGPSWSG